MLERTARDVCNTFSSCGEKKKSVKKKEEVVFSFNGWI